MNSSTADFPDLTDAQVHHCNVWSYLVSHSLLLLRAYKDDFLTGDTLYLLFEGVLYFEGPMSWQGVDFHLGAPEECLRLLRKKRGYDNISDDHLLERTRLFKAETPDGEVRILASNVYRGKDIPADFFWLLKTQQ